MLTLIRKLTEKSLLLLYVILGGMFLYAILSVEDCDNVGNVDLQGGASLHGAVLEEGDCDH